MALAFTTDIVTKEQLARLSQAAGGTTGFLNTTLSGAVTASAPEAMTVDIAATAAADTIHDSVESTAATSAAAGTAISAADANDPRIDLVVLTSAYAFAVRAGSPAVDPVPGTLVAGDVELAQVYVGAGVTEITSGNITDRRQLTGQPRETMKYKTSTQVFSATTTLADVAASTGTFTFTVAASEVWIAEYWIDCTFSTTGGVKFQIAGPATPTDVQITGTQYVTTTDTNADRYEATKPLDPVTAFATNIASAPSIATSARIAGQYWNTDPPGIYIRAIIRNGANAGNVTLQAAQNTAAGTTTLGLTSFMRARKIA